MQMSDAAQSKNQYSHGYQCAECGYVFDLQAAPHSGPAVSAGTAEVAMMILSTDDTVVRRRPEPDTWSPLEYACHLRDNFPVQRERILVGRLLERPVVHGGGRDERAVYVRMGRAESQ